jgi:hypothetical protein
MVVAPDGRLTHLVWLKEEGGRNHVHYVQVDETAASLVARDLDLPLSQLRLPEIAPTGNANLHLLWSSRADGQREWDLQYGQIDQSGELAGETRQLAMPADDIAGFSKVSDGQGGIYVAWEAEADGAIYGAHIASNGDVLQERMRLVEHGQSPSLSVDGGNLYMTWLDEFDVKFAQWRDGKLSEADAIAVASIVLGRGKSINGPELGLSGEWAYVIWSIFKSTGLEAGTASTEYIAFPKDAPFRSSARRIQLSPDEEQAYAPYESAYRITQLAPPVGPASSTEIVREPNVTDGRGDELAVAVAATQDLRLDTLTQIGMMIFKEGEFKGYQMAGKTDAFSQEPVLGTDEAGNLHIAWREGGHGSVAYYAVTKPEARADLDRMETSDIANVAFSSGIEVVTGILFFPLACIWLVPGLLLIGLWHFWRGESDLNNPATVVILIISILVSQVMKFLFLPTITTYIPFSAWFDVSPSWQQPLQIIVPIFTMSIGLLVAFLMRRRTPSGLAFFFWFTATDALLTLAIYGVTILGVF